MPGKGAKSSRKRQSLAAKTKKSSRLEACSCENCKKQDASSTHTKNTQTQPGHKNKDKHTKKDAHHFGHDTKYDIFSKLFFSDILHGAPLGRFEHYCFKCMLDDLGQDEAAIRLKRIFNNEQFLEAKSDHFQRAQLSMTSQLKLVVDNESLIKEAGFLNVNGFYYWLFRCDLLPAYERMLQENMDAPGTVHDSFYTVPHFILGVFIRVLIPIANYKVEEELCIMDKISDQYNRIHYAEQLIRSKKLIKMCVRLLKEPRTVIDTINSLLLLDKLAELSDAACKQIIAENGLEPLVELGMPGKFVKRVAKERDSVLRYYVREIIYTRTRPIAEVPNYYFEEDRRRKIGLLPEEFIYQEIVSQYALVLEAALSTLSSISDRKEFVHTVYNTANCVNTVVRWLRHPLMVEERDSNIVFEATALLKHFLQDGTLAKCLVAEKDILTLLDRLIYATVPSLAIQHIETLTVLLSHGGPVKNKVYENRHILLALGCYMHSRLVMVQAAALDLLLKLVKDRKSVLHLLNSLGLVNELMMFPYSLADTWEEPVPKSLLEISKIAKRTLKLKWKNPHIANFVPCEKGEFELVKLRKRGNDCFKEGCYEEAIRCYTAALILSVCDQDITAILLSNRAECHLRKKRYRDVVRDTTMAIANGFDELTVYVKTLFRRAKAFHELKRPFEAFGDITVCLWKQPNESSFKDFCKKVLPEYRKLEGAIHKIRRCDECFLMSEGLRKCAACDAHFCSKTCQKLAWPMHRESCNGKAAIRSDEIGAGDC